LLSSRGRAFCGRGDPSFLEDIMKFSQFFKSFGSRSVGATLKEIKAKYPYELSLERLTAFLQGQPLVDDVSKKTIQSGIKEKYPIDITLIAKEQLEQAAKNKKFSGF
jgi:hypothetical protein